MRFEDRARFEVRESVHARRFDDELVVLDLSHGEYFALDEVGARVWEGMAAGRTLRGLCDAMLSAYEVEREQLWQDVLTFAEALVASGLMRVMPEESPGLMHPTEDRN